jgi:hypothetical protein
VQQQPHPKDLAAVPAGPKLARLLPRIELRAVPDEQVGGVLAAEYRQLAHQQARAWQAMVEVLQRHRWLEVELRLTPDRVFDSAASEIRAELGLTRRAAERELGYAETVASVPQVAQALSAGQLDRTRAIVLAEGCWDLTVEQQATVLKELLPCAGQRTASELADRLRKLAVALDPGWAERRYKQAVRERRVVCYLNQDGSATLSGQQLPADQAAGADARIQALAKAAKRAGAHATMDRLRSELFLGLMDGRFHGMTEQTIIAALRDQFPKAVAEPEPQLHTAGADPDTEWADTARRGVHVKVGLATLLGDSDEPGEIAGLGTVTAAVARRLVAGQRKAEWRFAIVDDEGRLLFDGITRRRPNDAGTAPQAQTSGGIVELHVPLSLLADRTGFAHPQWSAVLADLRIQYADQQPIEQDPAARHPGRRLRRRVQVIAQTCTFRGCRRPAAECDLDHRHDHANGGRTEQVNLDPDCRHDHNLKTRSGWRVARSDNNTRIWISPLGRKYPVQIEPIAPPLPKPIPRKLPAELQIGDDDPPQF